MRDGRRGLPGLQEPHGGNSDAVPFVGRREARTIRASRDGCPIDRWEGRVSARRRDRDQDDPELRRLLSGLSEPGPPPDDLVARISRSLADEPRPALGRPHHFDSATAPRRRRVVLTLGAAALVGVVGAALALHLDDEVVVREAQQAWAAVGADDRAPDLAAPAAMLELDETEPVEAPTPTTQDALTGLTILTSGTDYERAHFAAQIEAVAHGRPASDVQARGPVREAPTREVPSREAIATCLGHADLQAQQGVLDVATFEGRPALVVLADRREGADREMAGASPSAPEGRVALVLAPGCARGSVKPLVGPVSVP